MGKTLAWHETLEVHELVAFQSIGLMKLKKMLPKVSDSNLKKIYEMTIKDLEKNLRELLSFYPEMPEPDERAEFMSQDVGFYAGDLLILLKTAVRNYAIAITETATPALRKVLVSQMEKAITGHERIFNYMYEKGMYPAYDLNKLLEADQMNAKKALKM
ncbi:spore coat protein [Bacillaceae bacterium S4-13-58]